MTTSKFLTININTMVANQQKPDTALTSISGQFAGHLDRLEKNISRIGSLSSILEQETPHSSSEKSPTEPVPFGDGTLYNLNERLIRLSRLNDNLEYLADRMEKYI